VIAGSKSDARKTGGERLRLVAPFIEPPERGNLRAISLPRVVA